jgi:hypothetical protein
MSVDAVSRREMMKLAARLPRPALSAAAEL